MTNGTRKAHIRTNADDTKSYVKKEKIAPKSEINGKNRHKKENLDAIPYMNFVKGNLTYKGSFTEIKPKKWSFNDIKKVWHNLKRHYIFLALKLEGSTITFDEITRTLNGEKLDVYHTEGEQQDLQGMVRAYEFVEENLKNDLTLQKIEEINLWVGLIGKRINKAGHIRGTIPMPRKDIRVLSGGREFIGVSAGTNGEVLVKDIKDLLKNINNDKTDSPVLGFKYSAKATLMQYFTDGNKRTARLVQDWINAKNGYIPVLFVDKKAEFEYETALQELFAREDGTLYINCMCEQYMKTEELFAHNP
jgi:Fic family protein